VPPGVGPLFIGDGSTGCLVGGLVVAIPTALAVAPMGGPWTLATTALAAVDGGLATPLGSTVLVLAVLILAGLTLITVRGLRTGRAVSDALDDGRHTFDLSCSLRFEAVVDGIKAFTGWVRSTEAARDDGSHAHTTGEEPIHGEG
jgi:hypothetical protein